MNEAGERIKILRKSPEVNLSQDAFGERIGVTGAAISRIEKGVRNMSEQMIVSICREFCVNRDWLEFGQGEMFVERSPDEEFDRLCAEIMLSDDQLIKNIMRAYWNLSDAEKAVIQKLLDGIEAQKKRAE